MGASAPSSSIVAVISARRSASSSVGSEEPSSRTQNAEWSAKKAPSTDVGSELAALNRSTLVSATNRWRSSSHKCSPDTSPIAPRACRMMPATWKLGFNAHLANTSRDVSSVEGLSISCTGTSTAAPESEYWLRRASSIRGVPWTPGCHWGWFAKSHDNASRNTPLRAANGILRFMIPVVSRVRRRTNTTGTSCGDKGNVCTHSIEFCRKLTMCPTYATCPDGNNVKTCRRGWIRDTSISSKSVNAANGCGTGPPSDMSLASVKTVRVASLWHVAQQRSPTNSGPPAGAPNIFDVRGSQPKPDARPGT